MLNCIARHQLNQMRMSRRNEVAKSLQEVRQRRYTSSTGTSGSKQLAADRVEPCPKGSMMRVRTCSAALTREIRRIQEWYRVGRREVRIRRRGIIRDRQQAGRIGGVRVVISAKVQAHYRRLLKPLRIEGMMKWRKISLATRVPVQSGTVGVERLWSILVSMLPTQDRIISPRWFRVLAMLMFVRYNFDHYRAYWYPLMAQRLEAMEILLQATKGCLLYTSPSPRDKRQSRMPSSA